MKTNKVAVTGGSGFLGRHVVSFLSERGYIPIILSSRRLDSADYCKTDYTVEDLGKSLTGVDAVIHLAAKRGGTGNIQDFHQNEVLAQNVFEACSRNGISNVVFASSISVYSEETALPWTETQIPVPVNAYGISKLAVEHLGSWYVRNKNLSVKSLRLAHLYGALEKNNYMINLFLRQAFLHKILRVNDVSGKREFLYVKDAARALVDALAYPKAGVYNIGSAEAYTNRQIAERINDVFGNTGNIEAIPSEGKIASSYFSSEQAQRDWGYRPIYTFQSALEEILEEMRQVDVQEFY